MVAAKIEADLQLCTLASKQHIAFQAQHTLFFFIQLLVYRKALETNRELPHHLFMEISSKQQLVAATTSRKQHVAFHAGIVNTP